MKKLTLSIIALLMAVNAGAQATFEKIVHSDRCYMDGVSSINDGDGFIVNVDCYDPSVGISSASLLRLDANGRTTDSVGCQTPDGMPISVFDLIPDNGESGTFYTAGMSYSEGRKLTDIAVATYDRDLNMTACYVFKMDSIIMDGLYDLTQRAVLNPDGSIAIAGHVRLTSGQCGYFLARVSADGTLLDFKTQMVCDTNYPMFGFFILRENPLEYGITCFGPGTSPGEGIPMLYVYDRDFNEIESRMLTQFTCGDNMPYQTYVIGGLNAHQMLALNDSTCYTFTKIDYYNYTSIKHGTGAMRFNRDFEIDGYSFTSKVEGDSYERTAQHAAFYLDGDGLVGCATGHPNNYVIPDKFYIARYDHDLNVVWQRAYKFSGRSIFPYCICGTTDGGSLIVGQTISGKCSSETSDDVANLRTDNNRSDWHDLYILKVNSNGEITAASEIIEAIPFLVYPNPAGNSLHLDISPDTKVGSISLYDLSGRIIKTQTISFETIDISGFAPGIYIMKVTLENGKVFEEKIVKK